MGLLDYANSIYQNGAPFRKGLFGLLSGDTTPLSGLLGDVSKLNDPAYVNSLKGKFDPQSDQVAQFAMGMNPMMALHTVWHGSPHTFDKFDMSKIGTGEGAQAYGHGLYFAENPQVAKEYQESLSGKYPISHSGIIEEDGKYKAWAKDINKNNVEIIKESATKYDANKALKEFMVDKNGALYKVNIPDEAIPKMLDWDKPLSQQHPDVQAVADMLANTDDVFNAWTKNGTPINGSMIYDRLSGSAGMNKGNIEGRKFASNLMKQNGVTGIRYLDGNSRGTGGTSNFVLFDDQLPTILERNGKPIK